MPKPALAPRLPKETAPGRRRLAPSGAETKEDPPGPPPSVEGGTTDGQQSGPSVMALVENAGTLYPLDMAPQSSEQVSKTDITVLFAMVRSLLTNMVAMKEQMSDLGRRVGGQEVIVAVLKDRMGAMEVIMAALKDRMGAVEVTLAALKDRTGGLKDRMGALEATVAALKDRVGAMEVTVAALKDRVGAMEVIVADLKDRMGAVEVIVADLKDRMGALEATVKSLGVQTTAEIRSTREALEKRLDQSDARTGRVIWALVGGFLTLVMTIAAAVIVWIIRGGGAG